MARPNQSSPQKLVLGFVIRESDTRQNILFRFNERFASQGFAKSAGYNSLKELVAKGDLELVDGVFVATPQGKREFREWLLGQGQAPGIRSSILGKLEFIGPADLHTVMGILKDEEAEFKRECNKITVRVQDEQRKRLRQHERGVALEETFDQRVRAIQSKHEANLWKSDLENIENLREELETLIEDLAAGKVPCA